VSGCARSARPIGRSRKERKPDAKRKRDSAQPQDAKRKRDSAQPQERAQPVKENE